MRVVERAVDGLNGTEIRVRVGGEKVEVQWGCRRRVFTPDDLRAAISDIRVLRHYPDVSMRLVDSAKSPFTVRLEDDGSLVASDGGERESVQWRQLRKALEKGLRDFEARTAPAKDDDEDDDEDLD